MRRLPQLDPELASIEQVRCFGCGRYLGVAPEVKMAVFCEELCWHQAQVINFENAVRNRAIRYLVEQGGHSMVQVALAFGMSRSVIGDILAHGNEGDYLAIARSAPVSDEFRAKRVRAGKISAERRYGRK